jgi:peptide/nickel transport system substrate-binding protein
MPRGRYDNQIMQLTRTIKEAGIMKMKRLSTSIILVVMVLLLAFPSAAAQKDTVVIAYPQKFSTLDYYQLTTRASIHFGNMVWDTLVRQDIKTGKMNPRLALSWKRIDPTTWEFKLRPGVKFHNGNPFNAEAVRYTVEECALNPKSGWLVNFKFLKKAEVVDDLTVRIISHKPFPIFLNRIASMLIYDPVYCKQVGDKKVAEAPMGTGPYQFVKHDRGNQLVLKKNPNYWEKGVPKIENLIFRIIPETSTRMSELISGGVDFAFYFTPDNLGMLKGNVVPVETETIRVNFWQFDSSGRASKTPLTDKRVRQAICHAIDRKAIIKNVMRGLAGELDSPMHPLQFGYDPSVKFYDYNPEKARALLKEAGYEKGFTLDVWYYEDFQSQPNQAAMGYLSKVGIKVNLKSYEGNIASVIELRNGGKITGVGNYNWGSNDIFDCEAILPVWFLIDENKCYNKDRELSDWLKEAGSIVDHEKRKELYSRAHKRIIEEAYWMPFFSVYKLYGRNKNLNISVEADDIPRFDTAYWK